MASKTKKKNKIIVWYKVLEPSEGRTPSEGLLISGSIDILVCAIQKQWNWISFYQALSNFPSLEPSEGLKPSEGLLLSNSIDILLKENLYIFW